MAELSVRCEGDRELHAQLLEIDEVQKARRQLEENPTGGVRRQLLATSLRLTKSMSPKLYGMLEACAKRLGLDIEIESYVYNSPTFNAACIKPEDGTLLLMFSSSLLERFDETELSFVMGHELGHHLYNHHDIPIGMMVRGKDKVSPKLALQLFSWSRYAEISADRAGAICTDDPDGAARALFKLASGLTSDLIEIRIDEFAAQADEMDLERQESKDEAHSQDWFMTHPFSPLRVKALQLFFQSEWVEGGKTSKTQLESDTHSLMEMMAPTYLEEKTEVAETMRRVLFAAGCGLMRVSGEIVDEEIKAFEELFGEGSFTDKLDIDALEEALEKRIKDAVQTVPLARRIHIVRDLCLIAVADGRVTKQEREYVYKVGKGLKLRSAIIEHCFAQDGELD